MGKENVSSVNPIPVSQILTLLDIYSFPRSCVLVSGCDPSSGLILQVTIKISVHQILHFQMNLVHVGLLNACKLTALTNGILCVNESSATLHSETCDDIQFNSNIACVIMLN